MTKLTAIFRQIYFILLTFLSCISYVQAESFLFTTWNLEWLTEPNSDHAHKYNKRDNEDILALREHFLSIQPDILAFQEVDSIRAIKQIVGEGYNIYLSDRSLGQNRHLQFKDVNQYTGFALKQELKVKDDSDLDLLPKQDDKLRFASYIEVERNKGNKLHLLSVHLKAGCRGKKNSSYSCTTLKRQATNLNHWLTERVDNGDSFIVAGDFNHNLAYPNDWLYTILVQGIEEKTVLTSRESEADCLLASHKNQGQVFRFRHLIDHIIISADLVSDLPKQDSYPKSKVLSYQLSDHCPLSSVIY